VPEEGTLTFTSGILSVVPIDFGSQEKISSALVKNGFRTVSGQCDESLYPSAAEYARADKLDDYTYFNQAVRKSTAAIRRKQSAMFWIWPSDGMESIMYAIFLIIIIMLWMGILKRKVLQADLKMTVVMAGIFMVAWVLLRMVKYQLLPEQDILRRYCWYGYYLCELSMPLLFLRIAGATDNYENASKPPKWLLACFTVNAVLMALVFTNEFHQLVFQFDRGDFIRTGDYSYNIGYYIVYSVMMAETMATLMIYIYKAYQSHVRKAYLFPILTCALMIAYPVGYAVGWINDHTDYTVTMCLLMTLFITACVYARLIPVNSGYRKFFARSTLKMQIVNADGQTVMAASDAFELPQDIKTELMHVSGPLTYDRDTVLYSEDIKNGRVIWQEDISKLNKVNSELDESVRRTKALNAMLSEQERIESTLKSAGERARLAAGLENEISERVAELQSKLNAIADQSGRAADDAADQSGGTANAADKSGRGMAETAMLLCYIKRRCNLFFREQESMEMPVEELCVYVDELAEFAVYAGINMSASCRVKGEIAVRQATLMYDLIYAVLEQAEASGCRFIIGQLAEEGDKRVLKLLPSKKLMDFQPTGQLAASIETSGGALQVRDIDDAISITLSFDLDSGDAQKEGGKCDA